MVATMTPMKRVTVDCVPLPIRDPTPIARSKAANVTPGPDLAVRFTLVATAVAALPARSCLIDSEAIARDENGLASSR
jgi:hypothetical protein